MLIKLVCDKQYKGSKTFMLLFFVQVKSSKRFIVCDGKLFSYCCVGTRRKRNSLVSHETINKPAELSVGNAAKVSIKIEHGNN